MCGGKCGSLTLRWQEIIHMSKSHDSKKSARKLPQKTLKEKRQAKHDKKNRQHMLGASLQGQTGNSP
jgi:hypothetical protein